MNKKDYSGESYFLIPVKGLIGAFKLYPHDVYMISELIDFWKKAKENEKSGAV